MAALFRRKKKLPSSKDVLKSLDEYLGASDLDPEALNELVQTSFESLKSLICGNDDEEVTPTQAQSDEVRLRRNGKAPSLHAAAPPMLASDSICVCAWGGGITSCMRLRW
eukprot:Amastigsp_a681735_7.p2 type:complete len:110 gc:universal Amastigsp_a681735_7:615-286(-)